MQLGDGKRNEEKNIFYVALCRPDRWDNRLYDLHGFLVARRRFGLPQRSHQLLCRQNLTDMLLRGCFLGEWINGRV